MSRRKRGGGGGGADGLDARNAIRERHEAAPDRRERFRAAFAVSETNLDEGTYRGFATVYDYEFYAYDPEVWRVIPTIIHQGACAKTLQENAGRVKILYQHNDWEPIGKPIALTETAAGLEITGKISKTQRGSDTLTLLRDGVISEQSIGFITVKCDYDFDSAGNKIRRHIREIKLDEVSLVTWGANDRSLVSEVNTDPSRQAAPEAALAQVIGLVPTLEQHAGKVLSGANKKLVQDCVDAMQSSLTKLQAMLQAAEPPPAEDPSTEEDNAESRALTEERHARTLRLLEIQTALGVTT